MTDLEQFAQWAKERGYYQVGPLIVNFHTYKKSLKEKELAALQERTQKDG